MTETSSFPFGVIEAVKSPSEILEIFCVKERIGRTVRAIISLIIIVEIRIATIAIII